MKGIAIVAAVLCCCLAGCAVAGEALPPARLAPAPPKLIEPVPSAPSGADGADGTPATYLTGDGAITFTMGGRWVEQEQSVYDLLCVDSSRGMATGVFSYSNSGMIEGVSPISLLEFHIKDIESKRGKVKRLEDYRTSDDAGHKYTTVLLSGERDGTTFCYYFTLVEFFGFSRRFAVVVQSTGENEFESMRGELDAITASAWLSGSGAGSETPVISL